MEKAELISGTSRMLGRRILIVGDVGVDEYVDGEVKRISPEAPVPVLEVEREMSMLGLSANVAQNVQSLGGEPLLVSVVGVDSGAEVVRHLLAEQKMANHYLVADSSRPTTRKLRVMSGPHHLVRVDRERRRFLDQNVEDKVLLQVKALLPQCDMVVLQDYAKGVVSESLAQKLVLLSHGMGKKVVADPHRATPLKYYRGVDLVKPNRDECLILAGLPTEDLHHGNDVILRAGAFLQKELATPNVVITQGKQGMTLFEGAVVRHIPTAARQVFDVTGAGDTVISALAMAWAGGLSLEQACQIANAAASVVVAKVGCVPCSRAELLQALRL